MALLSMIMASAAAGTAAASTVVSGATDTTSSLVIDPTQSPTDAYTAEVSLSGRHVAFIERLKANKLIDHVTLGYLGQDPACTSPTKVRLFLYEHDTNAIDVSKQLTYSDFVALPATPGKVTFSISPTFLRSQQGYSFMLSTYDGCGKAMQTTWAHNSAVVNAGEERCTKGPEASPNDASGIGRMWHVQDQDDRDTHCVSLGSSPYWDPSMPTGWLQTHGDWVYAATRWSSPPSASTACGSGAALAGAQAKWWRESPGMPGYADYVCVWPQFAAYFGGANGGWFYALPWRTDGGRNGAPRDDYIRLATVASGPGASELYGLGNPGEPGILLCQCGDPVNSATGNFAEDYEDLSVGGVGGTVGLGRTYNTQAAANATSAGRFGYGWSSTFGDHLNLDQSTGNVTVVQANGSTVPFTPNDTGGYAAPGWVHAMLTHGSNGSYTYTLPQGRRSFTFDGNGRLTSQADRNGNVTALSYDANGQLATITAPGGRQMTLDYNADGTVRQASDPAGHHVSYTYTGGDLTGVTDANGGSWQFGYDGSHRLTSISDPRGKTMTSNVYDTHNRVTSQMDARGHTTTWDYTTAGHTKVTSPSGTVVEQQFQNNLAVSVTKAYGTSSAATTSYAYDASGNLTSRTDARGHTWSYVYDDDNNRISATDPLNRTTSWTYDGQRNVTSETMPSGHKTTLDYDGNGNLTTIKQTLAETGQVATTSYAYDGKGQLTSTTDPGGHTSTYGHNAQGDQTSITTPAGHVTTSTYDDDGRLASTTSARGNEPGATTSDFTTTYSRNGYGQPTDIVDPTGTHTTLGYDADGRLTDVTDRDGRHTVTAYDDAGEVTQVTRPDGSVLGSGYDVDGRLTRQTDGLGKDVTYAYDALGNVSGITDELNRQTTFRYDPEGNQTSLADPSGRTVSYTYDNANQLTDVTYSSGNPSAESFTYNRDGQRTSVSDATGTTSYTYDSLGRLVGQQSGAGQQVGYGYDLAGRLTSIDYPDALGPLDLTTTASQTSTPEGSVTRQYDDDGNLTSVSDWLGHTTTFAYDAEGNLSGVTRPNGTSGSFSRNPDGLVTSLTDVGGTTSYGRSSEGLLTTGPVSGVAGQTFSYDGARRLTGAGSAAYAYDAGDNPTQVLGAAGQALVQSFDAGHELATLTQGSTAVATLGYDAQGNRTSRSDAGGAQSVYTYDQANELIAYQGPDHRNAGQSTSAQYVYDAAGLRQTKTVDNILTNTVYDVADGLPSVIEDGPTAYVTGPSGLPIEQIAADGTVRYFSSDQLGSTTALTDSGGATAATYAYDAYGNATATGNASNPFQYAGQYTDAETGLQYLRARYYDPDTAQMLSRDPAVATTRQAYTYSLDSPTNYTDPSGLIGLPSLQSISDSVAGTFDTLTFGATRQIRSWIGSDGTDYCSAAYLTGSGAGFALGMAIPFEDIGQLGRAADAGAEIDDILAALAEGRQLHVRTVGSEEELRSVYDQLAAGGKLVDKAGYPGKWVERPDGTGIGIRQNSKSGGATIDLRRPDGSIYKVHVG